MFGYFKRVAHDLGVSSQPNSEVKAGVMESRSKYVQKAESKERAIN